MRRLRRIIFHGLTVLSLVLCVATVVIWVRSYWRMDRIKISRNFTLIRNSSFNLPAFEQASFPEYFFKEDVIAAVNYPGMLAFYYYHRSGSGKLKASVDYECKKYVLDGKKYVFEDPQKQSVASMRLPGVRMFPRSPILSPGGPWP